MINMVKHGNSIIISVDLEKAFDLTLHYFGSLGYTIKNNIKPTHISLEYGNAWLDDGKWETKARTLDIIFSKTNNDTMIRFSYDLNWLTHTGKKDFQGANNEIQGLEHYLNTSMTTHEKNNRDRVCVKCKKQIPWDANLCPYCGHDFSNKQESKDKICLYCGSKNNPDYNFCVKCKKSLSEVNK